ncbi:MAG: FHA domain-containing protein [Anaerolineae bacterium]|nr:FHA domain-containing protein [Anaerolineae bacterium]
MRDLNPAIYGENIVVLQWYSWIAFVTLGVALLGAFWIFYDSQRKGTEPLIWKVLIVVSIVFLVPSVAVAIDERIAQNVIHAVPLLAYLGIGAAVAGLISILGYLAKIFYNAEVYAGEMGMPPYPASPLPTFEPPTGQSPAPPWAGGATATDPGQIPPVAPLPTENIGGSMAGVSFLGGPAPGVPGPAKTELLHQMPEEMAFLVIRSGPRAGKEYRLAEVTTLGRDAQQCDIVLDDTSASGQHARVKLEKGRFVLHDLASTNGTKVNNSEIDRHILEDGDQINIGRTTLSFMQVKSGKL